MAEQFQVQFRGPIGDFYQEVLTYTGTKRVREVVFRGPAGTGKSRSILQMLALLCLQVPGLRVVLCRRTRKSMTESTLVEWEKCFPPDTWASQSRTNRSVYEFPNGSEVACYGLDEPMRLYSTSWDVVYVEEVNEVGISAGAWEEFYRGLRNWRLPTQQLLLGSYNPSTPDHWVERRCDEGKCQRVLTQFQDNPKWHDGLAWTEEGEAYIAGLKKLTGPRYKRLYLGIPSVAEGVFYPEYDPDVHLADVTMRRDERRRLLLSCKRWGIEDSPVEWTMGAMDFGYDAPGVLQVWAVDTQRRLWLLHEFYRTMQSHEWWADRLIEMHREYDLLSVFADPSDKEAIARLNYRIAIERGQVAQATAPGIVCKANNRKRGDRGGFEAVRSWLSRRIDGTPAVIFSRDSLMHEPEQELKRKGKPACFHEEIANFIFWKKDDGTRVPDEPDPNCDDHALDSARYLMTGAYEMDLRQQTHKPLCAAGTVGSKPQWPGGRTWEQWLAATNDGTELAVVDDDEGYLWN